MVMGFSTCSSAATLPVTMEVSKERMGVPDDIDGDDRPFGDEPDLGCDENTNVSPEFIFKRGDTDSSGVVDISEILTNSPARESMRFLRISNS